MFYVVGVVVVGCRIFTTLVWALSDGASPKVWQCLEESADGANTNDKLEGESQNLPMRNQTLFGLHGSSEKWERGQKEGEEMNFLRISVGITSS